MNVFEKSYRKLAFLPIALALFSPTTALSDLTECGGVWTNKGCDASVKTRTDSPKEETAKDAGDSLELSKKRSLFHELTMRAIRAKRDHQLEYDLDEVEQLCFKQKSTLAECKTKIKSARSELNAEVAQIASVQEQEKANKLRAEANRLQQERNKIEASNPTVVISERRRYYIDPYRLDGHRGSNHYSNRHKPIRYHRTGPNSGTVFKDKSYTRQGRRHSRRTAGGAAISVSGSGTIGRGTRIGISGALGGSSTTTNSQYSTTVR